MQLKKLSFTKFFAINIVEMVTLQLFCQRGANIDQSWRMFVSADDAFSFYLKEILNVILTLSVSRSVVRLLFSPHFISLIEYHTHLFCCTRLSHIRIDYACRLWKNDLVAAHMFNAIKQRIHFFCFWDLVISQREREVRKKNRNDGMHWMQQQHEKNGGEKK